PPLQQLDRPRRGHSARDDQIRQLQAHARRSPRRGYQGKIPVGTLWGDNSAGPLRDRGQSRKRSRPPITHRITRLPRRFAPPHLPSGPLWGYSLRPSTASERREADGPAFIASRQPPTGTPLGNQLSQSAAADCRIEGASSGNRTTKRVPPSSGNSAVMCPPCSSTICRLTNSPRPIPP